MKCTFFGHGNTSEEIQAKLAASLKKLKRDYPHINYFVVLAYMPGKKNDLNYEDYSNTVYPEGLEKTPPKYAIDKRNRWMVDKADYVVVYVKYTVGATCGRPQASLCKGSCHEVTEGLYFQAIKQSEGK